MECHLKVFTQNVRNDIISRNSQKTGRLTFLCSPAAGTEALLLYKSLSSVALLDVVGEARHVAVDLGILRDPLLLCSVRSGGSEVQHAAPTPTS